jgi:hypothetical protein
MISYSFLYFTLNWNCIPAPFYHGKLTFLPWQKFRAIVRPCSLAVHASGVFTRQTRVSPGQMGRYELAFQEANILPAAREQRFFIFAKMFSAKVFY